MGKRISEHVRHYNEWSELHLFIYLFSEWTTRKLANHASMKTLKSCLDFGLIKWV